LTGILIVRTLSREDYGAYAIVIFAVTALTLLSDSGLTSAILSIGGAQSSNDKVLARLVATAIGVRGRLVVVLIVVISPGIVYLLTRNAVHLPLALFISGLVAANLALQMSATTHKVLLEIRYDFSYVQRVKLISGISRLGAVALIEVTYSDIVLVILATLLASAIEWRLFDARLRKLIGTSESPDDELRGLFRVNIARTLPTNAFVIMQAQVLQVALAALGATATLADITAASRFAALFAVVNQTLNGVLVPAFSRYAGSRQAVLRRYIVIASGYAGLLAVGWLMIWALAPILIRILGPDYAHLTQVMLIVTAGAVAYEIASSMHVLSQARGWLRGSWIFMPLSAIWTTFLLVTLNIRDVHVAALFYVLSQLPALLMNLFRVWLANFSPRRGSARDGGALLQPPTGSDGMPEGCVLGTGDLEQPG
jgi:O-antigen/teichoic acid export membrane protein